MQICTPNETAHNSCSQPFRWLTHVSCNKADDKRDAGSLFHTVIRARGNISPGLGVARTLVLHVSGAGIDDTGEGYPCGLINCDAVSLRKEQITELSKLYKRRRATYQWTSKF